MTSNTPDSSARKKLGNWGEQVAATRLEADGYRIVARNWRCAKGEIDLVAQAGDGLLVFVEVKTRRGRSMGLPEEALTPHKSRQLIQLAEIYLGEHDLDVEWRLDLMAVELDHSGKLLRCVFIVENKLNIFKLLFQHSYRAIHRIIVDHNYFTRNIFRCLQYRMQALFQKILYVVVNNNDA